MEKLQTHLRDSICRARQFLASTQISPAGWGYSPQNRQIFIEPTCWALMSLHACPKFRALVEQTVTHLLAAQREDGSWTNAVGTAISGDIRTALVAWTLGRCFPESSRTRNAVEKAANWLRQHRCYGGWSWCYGAHSFLEPTVMAVLALAHLGKLESKHALAQFMKERQCLDGGWNSHVPVMLDVQQPGLVSVTPIALIGLVTLGLSRTDQSIVNALGFLRKQAEHGELQTNYTRAYCLWAWSVLGINNQTVLTVLTDLLTAQQPGGHWDNSILTTALASVVLQTYCV